MERLIKEELRETVMEKTEGEKSDGRREIERGKNRVLNNHRAKCLSAHPLTSMS
jgi:hypothetical protein